MPERRAGRSPGLDPIRNDRSSIRDQVTDSLRAAITTGDMAPGYLYSAPALAEMLGVSATPVREAMIDLAHEGLVSAERNRGYRVVELSDDSLDQLTDLRLMIEVPAMTRLAASVAQDALDELRPLADDLVRHAAKGALRAFIEADNRFHLTLLGLTGNEWVVNDVRRLRSLSRLYGLSRLADAGRLTDTAHEHHEILDALAEGSEERVQMVMRRHIGHVRGTWAG